MIGRLLLEWRTQQALEYKKKNKQYTMRKYFKMTKWHICWHLICQHYKQTQLSSNKISLVHYSYTALDKTHYRLKDATGLLLDGRYHVNQIKKGSAHTMQGIVNTFNDYKKALKNTLLNKFAIETPENKIQEVTLKDGSKECNFLSGTNIYYNSIYS